MIQCYFHACEILDVSLHLFLNLGLHLAHFNFDFPNHRSIYTFYLNVIFSPLETPAGISKFSKTLDTLIPVALQSWQGFLITNPIPLHLSHSRCNTIPPFLNIVEPEPPQARHLVGADPD